MTEPVTENLTLTEHVAALDAEGAGALELRVVEWGAIPVVFDAERRGSPGADELANMLRQQIARELVGTADAPVTCPGCKAPLLWSERSVAFVSPRIPCPTRHLAVGICIACAPDRAAVIALVMTVIRGAWPKARLIDIHPTAGRA
jgi:hypothetical protein